MNHSILYIIAILIAKYYIKKYSKKAEADINEFYKNKCKEESHSQTLSSHK